MFHGWPCRHVAVESFLHRVGHMSSLGRILLRANTRHGRLARILGGLSVDAPESPSGITFVRFDPLGYFRLEFAGRDGLERDIGKHPGYEVDFPREDEIATIISICVTRTANMMDTLF